uniref:Uncharacterized protein ycf23 n=1 Tax=Dipterocladia arabiensis TaxID=2007176 RepID=A0A1Z1M055_9FLOR|nr:hypothetical protein [Dipterocladia arabiensis]ARW59338.1 hypothetical protein [Dipterocladia arabiensis]
MNLFTSQLLKPFQKKQVIKVISGLNNLDIHSIISIVKSAEISNAHYIDIVANPQIVSFVKKISDIPICVSSIDPLELYNCSIAGADILEIGNFDYFYSQNIIFSISEILKLAKETRYLINNKDICVTIPHVLSLYDQVCLSKKLEDLGINILQTEGYFCNEDLIMYIQDNKHQSDNDIIFRSIKASAAALSSTYAISNAVNLPVITASGINYISSSMAVLCGASGIGLGSNLKKQKTIYNMSCYIDEMYYSMISQVNLHSFNNLLLLINKESKNLCLVY